MKKSEKDTAMKVEIIGNDKKSGVMIGGEMHHPGDVVEVGLMTGRSLIYRERAKPYDKASAKGPAKDPDKDAK